MCRRSVNRNWRGLSDVWPLVCALRFTSCVSPADASGPRHCAAEYTVAPVKVPEEVRSDVAEYLTRANYGLRIGNFELDYRDGEVRYKTSLDFEGAELLPPLIRNTVYPSVNTMDRYMPGLMSVIYGGKTPFEAIEDIEGK